MTKRIAILGPVPPPFGGVSIHVVRLQALLEKAGHQVTLLPYTGLIRHHPVRKLLRAVSMLGNVYRILLGQPFDVIHLHYGGLLFFLAVAPLIATRSTRCVVTFHAVRIVQDFDKSPAWVKYWLRFYLNRYDLMICVRRELVAQVRERGLIRPTVFIQPAFLPPAEEEKSLNRLPEALADELAREEEQGRLRVCCAAYSLGPGYGQVDLYGIEFLLAALQRAEERLSRVFVLYVLVSNPPAKADQEAALARLRRQQESLRNVEVRIHFGAPLIPYLARCHGFMRPSREDGDSVSVREALALNVPVLASDVVRRPAGVHLFHLEDEAESGKALVSFLNQIGEGTEPPPAESSADEQAITDLIRQLTEEDPRPDVG